MTAGTETTGRRITITLDMLESGSADLVRTVRLAARLGAELEGVFIEDQDLLHVSDLPFARELSTISLASEALSAKRIERELRLLARRAEHALHESAQQAGVRWHFRIWRGSTSAGLLNEFADSDILSLGRHGALMPCRRRPTAAIRSPVAVVVSESTAGRRALQIAIALAEDSGSQLHVIFAGPLSAAARQSLTADLAQLAHGQSMVRLIERSGPTPGDLRAALHTTDNAVLVIPGDYPYLQRSPLPQLLSALGCQVLIVH